MRGLAAICAPTRQRSTSPRAIFICGRSTAASIPRSIVSPVPRPAQRVPISQAKSSRRSASPATSPSASTSASEISYMLTLKLHRRARLARALMVGSTVALLGAVSCDSNGLLSAPDPDLISASDLDSPEGANALRIGALQRWRFATGGDNTNGQESTWLTGGLLADEWGTSSTFVQNDELDERRVQLNNATVTFDFRKLERVRTAVDQALPVMVKWNPTQTLQIAELYLARGFAEMQLASDFCNGIPLSDASTATSPTDIKFGDPLPVSQVFQTAISTLDSGYKLLAVADTASDVGRAIKVTKARALLGIGGAANVAAAAALMN